MKLYEPAPPARKDELANVQDGIAIIVDGDTCPVAVESGSWAYIKNNTHGLAEGLYKNKSNSAFPVSGGTADSTVFEADSTGGLNALNASLTVSSLTIANGRINITKCGNIVNISTNNYVGMSEIEDIPVGYRPKESVLCAFGIWNASSNTYSACSGSINTDGKIRAYSSSGSVITSGVSLIVNATYMI